MSFIRAVARSFPAGALKASLCSFLLHDSGRLLSGTSYTVLSFGTVLLLDPVHFVKYESCLLIGSILNFQALL